MKLIVNKNVFQSKKNFFQEIKDKDGIPIVITPYIDESLNIQLINYIQKNNLSEISGYELITLTEALETIKDIAKKILINFIPVSTTPYAQNIELINAINKEQVSNLYKVLNKFSKLNLYVSSVNHNIIFHLKEQESNHKIGVILSLYETNYIDVDFYIFTPEMLSVPILNQQLEYEKEVIIISRGCEDMMTTYKFFRKCPKTDGTNIFNNVSFISNYPLILYKLFK